MVGRRRTRSSSPRKAAAATEDDDTNKDDDGEKTVASAAPSGRRRTRRSLRRSGGASASTAASTAVEAPGVEDGGSDDDDEPEEQEEQEAKESKASARDKPQLRRASASASASTPASLAPTGSPVQASAKKVAKRTAISKSRERHEGAAPAAHTTSGGNVPHPSSPGRTAKNDAAAAAAAALSTVAGNAAAVAAYNSLMAGRAGARQSSSGAARATANGAAAQPISLASLTPVQLQRAAAAAASAAASANATAAVTGAEAVAARKGDGKGRQQGQCLPPLVQKQSPEQQQQQVAMAMAMAMAAASRGMPIGNTTSSSTLGGGRARHSGTEVASTGRSVVNASAAAPTSTGNAEASDSGSENGKTRALVSAKRTKKVDSGGGTRLKSAASATSTAGAAQAKCVSGTARKKQNSSNLVSARSKTAALPSGIGRPTNSEALSPVPPSQRKTPSPVPPQSASQSPVPTAAAAAAAAAKVPLDPIQARRAALVRTYAPHIQGTDTSLETARQRLRAALDQTRYLRQIYSDRIYDRYKINLQLVPATVDEMVEKIRNDPEGMAQLLREERQALKVEKEMEKKEAAKLTAALAESGHQRNSGMVDSLGAAETADQLAWFGAGLNTVILPESNLAKSQLPDHEFRGPIDIQSGQRVAGISAACATAAETLLDRVRRASVLRLGRKRRRLSGNSAGGILEEGKNGDRHAFLHLFPSGNAFVAGGSPSLQSGRGRKRSKTGDTSGFDAAGKVAGRSKAQPSNATLLNLDPSAEVVGKAKPTAAMAALVAAGVGENAWVRGTPRHFLQQKRWKHPFPDSKAGKKMALVSSTFQSGKKPAGVAASVASVFSDPKIIMAPLDAKARNASKPSKRLRSSAAAKPAAVKAISCVIAEFSGDKQSLPGGSGLAASSMTEVDYLFRATDIAPSVDSANSSTANTQAMLSADPVVTFSVMNALGLVQREGSIKPEKKGEFPPMHLKGKGNFSDNFADVSRGTTEKKLSVIEHIRGGGSADDDDDDDDDDNDNGDKSKNGESKGDSDKKRSNGNESKDEEKNDNLSRQVSKNEIVGKAKEATQSECNGASLMPILTGGTVPSFTHKSLLQIQQQQAQAGGLGVGGAGGQFASSLLSPSMRRAGLEDAYSSSMQAAAAHAGMHQDMNDYFGNTFHSQRAASAGYALPSDWASMSLSSANAGLSPQALASLSVHDRATRELLARDATFVAAHARAQAAAAHHHAAAAARGIVGMNALTHQQASTYMAAAAAAAAAGNLGAYAPPASMASYSAYGLSNGGIYPSTQVGDSSENIDKKNKEDEEPGPKYVANEAKAASDECKAQGEAKADCVEGGNSDEMNGSKEIKLKEQGDSSDDKEDDEKEEIVTEDTVISKSPASPANVESNKIEPCASKCESMSAKIAAVDKSSTTSNTNANDSDAKVGPDTNSKANSDADSSCSKEGNEETIIEAKATSDYVPRDSAADKAPSEDASSSNTSVNEKKDSAKDRKETKRIFVPLSTEVLALVDGSRFHEAVTLYAKEANLAAKSIGNSDFATCNSDNTNSVSKLSLLEYLLTRSRDVPIPKSIVSHVLKERATLLISSLKGNAGISAQLQACKDVVASVIVMWLWGRYKVIFQSTLSEDGELKVDHKCKWLIHAAVDVASRALISKPPSITAGKPLPLAAIDVRAAKLVSEALSKEFSLNQDIDFALANFEPLMKHLDNLRVEALKAKVQERTLLASLVARRSKMSEPFSNTYTSAMIRAGEALGHEDICDVAQDESGRVSTLLPFDYFDDESGAWEDPFRPSAGYNSEMAGEELIRKAHARAMVLKSMKKLQDRYGVKGGTPDAGPYVDSAPKGDALGSGGGMKSPPLSRTPSGLKRKTSFSGMSDSGSYVSKSTLFRPSHYSAPFIVDSDDFECLPYGRHSAINMTPRGRSMSMARFGGFAGTDDNLRKRRRMSVGESGTLTPSTTPPPPPQDTNGDGRRDVSADVCIGEEENDQNELLCRSTVEIEWTHVAEMFEPVALDGQLDSSKRTNASPSPRNSLEKHTESEESPTRKKGPIIAPFCREFDDSLLSSEDSDEGMDTEEEEDLSDEVVLARHQAVLDDMKQTLEHAMKMRQQLQDKQKSRSEDRSPTTMS